MLRDESRKQKNREKEICKKANVMEKEKSLFTHLSFNSSPLMLRTYTMLYHTILRVNSPAWDGEKREVLKDCNLHKFTRGKENPSISCSWCRKTLGHRLQEEVLLHATLLLYFAPLDLLLASFSRQNIKQQTISPIQQYHFYVPSDYLNS